MNAEAKSIGLENGVLHLLNCVGFHYDPYVIVDRGDCHMRNCVLHATMMASPNWGLCLSLDSNWPNKELAYTKSCLSVWTLSMVMVTHAL